MKIREIIELTQTQPLPQIAKELLPCGEKKIRSILLELGANKPSVGSRGWSHDNVNPTELEKDITEFLGRKATIGRNDSTSKSTKSKNENNKDENKKTIEYRSMHAIVKDGDESSGKDNVMKAEIQALIKGTSKEEHNRIYKGIYFDRDIAHFLDNVAHGNKSEIVNKIMRVYLTENDLM